MQWRIFFSFSFLYLYFLTYLLFPFIAAQLSNLLFCNDYSLIKASEELCLLDFGKGFYFTDHFDWMLNAFKGEFDFVAHSANTNSSEEIYKFRYTETTKLIFGGNIYHKAFIFLWLFSIIMYQCFIKIKTLKDVEVLNWYCQRKLLETGRATL